MEQMHHQDNTTDTTQQQQKSSNNDACHFFKFTHYVTVDYRPLHSPNLSAVAKALWVFGHSRPPTWVFYFSEIMTHFKEGERSLYNAFNELVKHRLAARFPYQMQMPGSKRWVFAGNEYAFFDKEVNDQELNEIRESLKKRFQDRRFLHPQIEDPQNAGLIKKEEESKDDNIENNAPSVDDAPKSKSSSKSKKTFQTSELVEMCSYHPEAQKFKEAFNRPLIGITDEDHKALMIKYGLDNTRKFYQYLADWKISKAQVSPKDLFGHTDIHRIKKWVIKQVLENPTSMPGGYKRTGKMAIEADKTAMAKLQETGTHYIDIEEFGRQILEKNPTIVEDYYKKHGLNDDTQGDN